MNILMLLLMIFLGVFSGYAASLIGLSDFSFYIGLATFSSLLILWTLRTQKPSSPKVVLPKPNGKNTFPLISFYLGIVICIIGVCLYMGNISGAFSTLPFVGGITSGVGVAIFALSKVALENYS